MNPNTPDLAFRTVSSPQQPYFARGFRREREVQRGTAARGETERTATEKERVGGIETGRERERERERERQRERNMRKSKKEQEVHKSLPMDLELSLSGSVLSFCFTRKCFPCCLSEYMYIEISR